MGGPRGIPYKDWTEHEKQQHREHVRRAQDKYQLQTQHRAHNSNQRWTEEETDIALFGSGTVRDRALVLGRSYAGTQMRINKVHRLIAEGLVITYHEPERPGRQSHSAAVLRNSRVLCPCGTSDGDHDSWCPEKTG